MLVAVHPVIHRFLYSQAIVFLMHRAWSHQLQLKVIQILLTSETEAEIKSKAIKSRVEDSKGPDDEIAFQSGPFAFPKVTLFRGFELFDANSSFVPSVAPSWR